MDETMPQWEAKLETRQEVGEELSLRTQGVTLRLVISFTRIIIIIIVIYHTGKE